MVLPFIKIATALVSDLLPYANNAREHTEEQVAQVAASITEFGWTNPIIIHGQTVVAGHARLAAARKLNMTEVPVIDRSDMSEAQWKAYVLADNQLAQNATWNDGLLALELDNLQALDFDLDLLGFGDDLAGLLGGEPEEGLTDPDDVPEPPEEPVTQPGDLWLLGDHRLLCGDSTDAESVAYLMDGAKADMVFTDPPYGIDVVSSSNKSVGGSKAFASVGGANTVSANTYTPIIGDDTTSAARDSYAVCMGIGVENYLIWGGNYFTDFLPPTKGWIVWDKKGRKWDDNFSDFEMAWTSYDVPAKIFTHVWMGMVQSGEREKRVHPTQKPSELVVECLSHFNAGSIILDPFLGSGTTLIAAERTGRKCYGLEIDPIYCDVIIARWEAFSGKKAVRA